MIDATGVTICTTSVAAELPGYRKIGLTSATSPKVADLANPAFFAQGLFHVQSVDFGGGENMATWRAQVKLPSDLDQKIRDYAVKNKLKLRDLIEAMISDGANVISNQGAAYGFKSATVWRGTVLSQVEYVVDESYRTTVDGLTAALTGSGKRGKALAETILLGAEHRKIA